MIFYMLGIGCLLPWNFFSNAKQVNTCKSENKHSTHVIDGRPFFKISVTFWI